MPYLLIYYFVGITFLLFIYLFKRKIVIDFVRSIYKNVIISCPNYNDHRKYTGGSICDIDLVYIILDEGPFKTLNVCV